MPIRFRCAYCNQLMGISHRKVGAVVRCPKCSGQVVVPTVEDGADDGPIAESEQAAPVNSLEDRELDKLLLEAAQEAAGLTKAKKKRPRRNVVEIDVEPIDPKEFAPPAPPAPVAAPPALAAPPSPPVEPTFIARTPAGWVITLSPGLAIGSIVALLLLISLGVLIGYLLGRPPAAIVDVGP
ncbi:MAG: hypothetical protein WCL32_07650 [Planctomycetota bacterium]